MFKIGLTYMFSNLPWMLAAFTLFYIIFQGEPDIADAAREIFLNKANLLPKQEEILTNL